MTSATRYDKTKPTSVVPPSPYISSAPSSHQDECLQSLAHTHQAPTARVRQCRRLVVKPRRVGRHSSSGEVGNARGVLAIGHDRSGEPGRRARAPGRAQRGSRRRALRGKPEDAPAAASRAKLPGAQLLSGAVGRLRRNSAKRKRIWSVRSRTVRVRASSSATSEA
jgi:hypothetical protein